MLIAEEGDERLIKVKVKSANGIIIEGEFKYNKADQAITYYSLNYQQARFPPYKRTNTEGKDFQYQLKVLTPKYISAETTWKRWKLSQTAIARFCY